MLAQDPQHERVVEELAAVHERAHDWESLELLMNAPESARALPQQRLQEWRTRIAQGRIEAAIAKGRLDELKAAWESAPASLRNQPELRRAHAAGLAKLNAEAEAAAQISAGLRDAYDARLVELYGELEGIEPVTQLATAEQWLGQHGETPELLWLAARACRRNKLWGKARSYLEGLVRIAPSPKAYLELAQLCQQMQAPDDAARYYRLGLEQAATHC
jgi:HemY protein